MTEITRTANHSPSVIVFSTIIVLLIIAALITVALLSYNINDPAWSHTGNVVPIQIQNNLGVIGAWYSDISFSLLGKLSYLVPIGLVAIALQAWFEKEIDKEVLSWKLVALTSAILSGCVLWTRHDLNSINSVAKTGGGALGAWLNIGLEKVIGSVPIIMAFSLVLFVIALTLLFNISWLKIADWIGKYVSLLFIGLFSGFAYAKTKENSSGRRYTTDDTQEYDESLQEKREIIRQAASFEDEKDYYDDENDDDYDDEEDEYQESNQSLGGRIDPKFTIDRYQPEEENYKEEKKTEKRAERTPFYTDTVNKRQEKIDLSYFGISDRKSSKNNGNSSTSTVVEDNSSDSTNSSNDDVRIDTTLPDWRNSSVEKNDNTDNAIPFSTITPSTQTTKSEIKNENEDDKSEPSLFNLGLLKRANLKNMSSSLNKLSHLPETDFDVSRFDDDELEENENVADNLENIDEVDGGDTIIEDVVEDVVQHSDIKDDIKISEPFFESVDITSTTSDTLAANEEYEDNLENIDADNDFVDEDEHIETTARTPEIETSKYIVEEEILPENQYEYEEEYAEQHDEMPVTQTQGIVKQVIKETTKATIGKVYNVEEMSVPVAENSYNLPSIDLLDTPPPQTNAYTEDMLADMALVLETTLRQFNVNATVMNVSPGPVITRFEIELAPGIQAKKISNLSQDLARALAVSRVRVEEVIPGSTYVGLEVPNKAREIVYFKDVVRSKAFQESKSPLTVSLGSDTSGKPVVADLMKMPHALVAGTTGSGKSVCINVMLLSMLYKASPKDLRLIMVDPKMLEMSMYEDIPHLLTPVITDMNEAENALTWAVGEMERRYQLMAALKVRKIDAFNEEIDAAIARGEPIKDPLWQPNESVGYTHHPTLERLPFIVIVIDELADMMMVVGKQVEQLIARLTQKARAAGIHVVLATQRPSTDVLTGLIKANVPTRVAFQVSSGTDSRVIIDSVGAEKLLGHGDMLYVPPGASHPQRLHGAFVGDAETDRVTAYLRSTGEPDYVAGITVKQDPETLGAFGAAEAANAKEDADPLYEEAIQIVLETGKASISSVQRQLRIGYNRAARMIEDMQDQGIVSEPVNGIRKVLGAPRQTDD